MDETLVALADPARRAILERLSQGEARVIEVAASFPISLNSVSEPIRILERAQLVTPRIAGREPPGFWTLIDQLAPMHESRM